MPPAQQTRRMCHRAAPPYRFNYFTWQITGKLLENNWTEGLRRGRITIGGEIMAKFTTGDPRINRGGAPTQQARVQEWYRQHPGGSVSACARELNISRPTARRWMPAEQRQTQQPKAAHVPAAQTRQRSTTEEILNILQQPGKIRQIVDVLRRPR